MKFAILMGDGGGAWERLDRAAQEDVFERHREFQSALEGEGKFVTSFRLAPSTEAHTVHRSESGVLRVTDGPFVEAKEVLGGVYVIHAESLAEALEWAKRARFISGSNEVRPILE